MIAIASDHDTPVASGPGGKTAGMAQAAVLMVGSCLPVMAAVLIAPVLPLIQAHFATVPNVDVLVPVMLTVPSLFLGLLAPFAGAIVDRAGRKRLLLASLLLYAFAGTGPLWLQSLPAIIASRALLGIAEAGVMTCCTTLIGDCFAGKQRERLLTLQTVCASLAATCFFAFGGALGELGWRAPFMLYLVGFVLLPLVALLLWEPLRTLPRPAATAVAATPFPTRMVAGICAVTLISALFFYVVPVHLSFMLDAMGERSPQRIGQAIAISSTATVVGAAAYPLLARLGLALHLATCFVLMSAGFLWLGSAAGSGYVTVVEAASLASLGAGALIPALANWMMRSVGFVHRGRAMGGFLASFFMGQFVCPLVVLALGAATGRGLFDAVHALGWALAVLTALALLAALRFRAPASVAAAAAQPPPLGRG